MKKGEEKEKGKGKGGKGREEEEEEKGNSGEHSLIEASCRDSGGSEIRTQDKANIALTSRDEQNWIDPDAMSSKNWSLWKQAIRTYSWIKYRPSRSLSTSSSAETRVQREGTIESSRESTTLTSACGFV